jgi:Peptidase family M28
MKERTALLFLLPLAIFVAGCSRQPGLFSEANARAHIENLAGTIGSRPIGSPANARARAYIIDQLRLFGFEVRVQETDARRGSMGQSARVANIIAVKPGRRPEALGLLSHYDSVPAGPGAADDAYGVAVSLEAARVLGARSDRNWTLMVLVTDGEEADLMGAAALATDRTVTDRLDAYINIEASGDAGPPFLFEVGPGNSWLVTPWASRAPWPRGGSFVTEIYKRLPNDTDFSILKQHEIPGLNFAIVGDSYAYHTARDTPERLSPVTVRRTGEQIVSVMTTLDGMDITQRSPGDGSYVDVAGTTALAYGPGVASLLAAAALGLGIVAWVRITATAIALQGVLRWILIYVWTLIGSAAVVFSMVGATSALRAAREVYHPWYARPGRLFLLMLAVGITVGWSFARLGQWLPARVRGVRHPVVAWTVSLPAWIALSAAALWMAPGAAALWMLPLLAAGLLLTVVPSSNSALIRAASVVILAVVGTLWIHNTVDLLRFIVALFGRLPIVTPAFVYAALMTVAGIMIVPPLAAIVSPRAPLLRPSLATALCLIAVAVTAGSAYLAPAYTHEEPLRRFLRVVHEADRPTQWEVASVEPGLDLAEGAPTGWTAGPRPANAFSVPIRNLQYPFVFHAAGPAVGAAPVSIAALSVEPLAAGTELTVTVVPRDPGLVVSFMLPAGLQPARANLPGVVRLGRWTATYVAPPADGVNFRASFGSVDRARLKELRIIATTRGFAANAGWQAPAWLPQDRAVWSGDASWVVAPFDLPIAPVPPLR